MKSLLLKNFFTDPISDAFSLTGWMLILIILIIAATLAILIIAAVRNKKKDDERLEDAKEIKKEEDSKTKAQAVKENKTVKVEDSKANEIQKEENTVVAVDKKEEPKAEDKVVDAKSEEPVAEKTVEETKSEETPVEEKTQEAPIEDEVVILSDSTAKEEVVTEEVVAAPVKAKSTAPKKAPAKKTATKKEVVKEEIESSRSNGKFVIINDPDNVGQYKFRLIASNGVALYESCSYVNKPKKISFDAFKRHVAEDSFEIIENENGTFSFNLHRNDWSNTVIGSSDEPYATKDSCEDGIEAVKRYAQTATVIQDNTEE